MPRLVATPDHAGGSLARAVIARAPISISRDALNARRVPLSNWNTNLRGRETAPAV
jgi:hypothetical protein